MTRAAPGFHGAPGGTVEVRPRNLGFVERYLANEHAINHAVQPDANSLDLSDQLPRTRHSEPVDSNQRERDAIIMPASRVEPEPKTEPKRWETLGDDYKGPHGAPREIKDLCPT